MALTKVRTGGITDDAVTSAKIPANAITDSELKLDDDYAFTGTITGAGGGFLGDGQTWQNVASSRATGTYYTNSTGKPIQVFVIFTAGSSANIQLIYTPSGGSEISGAGLYTNTSNGRVSITWTIPNGDQYKIAAGGSPTEQQWWELR
tara:strand:- start:348 stop:791 length:444 start_codon:yes stop_codon:yes gene_type:complete